MDTPYLLPRTDEEYDQMAVCLQALIIESENHPENSQDRVIATLTALLEAYDAEHHPIPAASGADVLRFLMEQHSLTQSQVPEVGPQSVVSEILSGKRKLNVRQITALAKRFGVGPAAFLPDPV